MINKAGGGLPTSSEEEATAKAKVEEISEPEPEKKEEAKLEAHKGDGKEDGRQGCRY
jgi:hypothetical protein